MRTRATLPALILSLGLGLALASCQIVAGLTVLEITTGTTGTTTTATRSTPAGRPCFVSSDVTLPPAEEVSLISRSSPTRKPGARCPRSKPPRFFLQSLQRQRTGRAAQGQRNPL